MIAVTQFGNDRVESTLELEHIAVREWDVVILGAGVAGASAAILAAKSGLKTLLVEAKTFPREKVCGGCLNRRAVDSLDRLGLLAQLHHAGAVQIQSLHLQIMKTSVQWSVPSILSVRRSTLDSMLVQEAIRNGAQFIDQTTGTLIGAVGHGIEPKQDAIARTTRPVEVRLLKLETSATIAPKCVLIASGLTRSSLKNPNTWPTQIHEESRIGVQCLLPSSHAKAYVDGQLHMLVGRNGYVGICNTDGGYVDIAAAIDPASIQPLGGIEQVVRGILIDCNATAIDWPETSTWSATPALTRTSKNVAKERVFLIGDAIGYVEPFTGEGMSWAFASAEAVLPHVREIARLGWRREMATQWNDWACEQRIHHQRTCRWIANRIRQPRGAAWFLQACNWIPPLRATIIRKTTQ